MKGTDAPSDHDLMHKLSAGDMNSLAILVRRHEKQTRQLAYRVLGRWDLADDVAQEAFIHVARAAARYQPDALFSTWLYRIVLNLCHDTRRRMKRAPRGLSEGYDAPMPDQPDTAEQDELAARVRLAVNKLAERQRTALLLHRYQGLSYRQISAATGWSESAIESLLVRAYDNLRKLLAPLNHESR